MEDCCELEGLLYFLNAPERELSQYFNSDLCFDCILKNRNFSESFLERNLCYLDIVILSYTQTLSEAFIIDNIENLSLEHVILNPSVSTGAKMYIFYTSRNYLDWDYISQNINEVCELILDYIKDYIDWETASIFWERGITLTNIYRNFLYNSDLKNIQDTVNSFDVMKTLDFCSICYTEDREDKVIFPCHKNHFFHKKCAEAWLLHQNKCPICRTTIEILKFE